MLKRIALFSLAGIVLGTSATVAVAALGIDSSHGSSMRQLRLEKPSGTIPPHVPLWLKDVLEANGFSGDLTERSRTRSGDTIATFRNGAGALCVATGGAAVCPNEGATLLEQSPIVDLKWVKIDAADRVTVQWWRGIAVDSVSSVDVTDSKGRSYSARTVGGTFEVEGPLVPPLRYEARDRNGKTVWSRMDRTAASS